MQRKAYACSRDAAGAQPCFEMLALVSHVFVLRFCTVPAWREPEPLPVPAAGRTTRSGSNPVGVDNDEVCVSGAHIHAGEGAGERIGVLARLSVW